MADILKKLKESKKGLFVGVAGPGTGKSTTFKFIIESEEYKGKKILILSFINKLIDDLKKDFKDYDNVTVSTLHSFANQKIGDVEFDEDLDKVISKDYFLMEGVPTDFNENYFSEKIHENSLSKGEEKFYEYRRSFYKRDKELHSFSSIIHVTNKYFEEHPDKIPDKYDLILIDEFQDFNKCEYEFIKQLNKKASIVLVGDENQSLYFFKQARPEQIIDLYNDKNTEEFSLDNCHRCSKVIVDSTNDLINNAKKAGYLAKGMEKKFGYPGTNKKQNEASEKHQQINFIPSVQSNQLIYKLAEDIKSSLEVLQCDKCGEIKKKRILILSPGYFKQTIYEGLIKKGFNVVEFELFSNEQRNNIKHKKLVDNFITLNQRKTDDLCLRKLLSLYLTEEEIKEILISSAKSGKKIWLCLSPKTKGQIEEDIRIFQKAKKGKNQLNEQEFIRFNKIFTLKNILLKMIKGFAPIERGAIEVEMTTVMSSKGLSADFVYYVGIDDRFTLDRKTGEFTDFKICEFLVGITRAKEKLTLLSFEDQNPKILNFVNKSRINRI